MAELCFENSDYVKAGKYWYLKPNKNQREFIAVGAFNKSVGGDPTLILKKLINKKFYKLNLLDTYQIEQFEII